MLYTIHYILYTIDHVSYAIYFTLYTIDNVSHITHYTLYTTYSVGTKRDGKLWKGMDVELRYDFWGRSFITFISAWNPSPLPYFCGITFGGSGGQSHIAIGDTVCYNKFASLYTALLDRYKGLLTGVLSGHTHTDEFKLLFGPSNAGAAVYKGITFGGVWEKTVLLIPMYIGILIPMYIGILIPIHIPLPLLLLIFMILPLLKLTSILRFLLIPILMFVILLVPILVG